MPLSVPILLLSQAAGYSTESALAPPFYGQ